MDVSLAGHQRSGLDNARNLEYRVDNPLPLGDADGTNKQEMVLDTRSVVIDFDTVALNYACLLEAFDSVADGVIGNVDRASNIA